MPPPPLALGYISEVVVDGESFVGYEPTNTPWIPDQDSIGWVDGVIEKARRIVHELNNHIDDFQMQMQPQTITVAWCHETRATSGPKSGGLIYRSTFSRKLGLDIFLAEYGKGTFSH